MGNEIPVRQVPIEEAYKEAIDKKDAEKAKRKVVETKLPERTYSVSGDWKVWAIAVFALISVVFAGGYFSRDTSIQDEFDNITHQKSVIRKANNEVAKLNAVIESASGSIRKSKDNLGTKGIIVK